MTGKPEITRKPGLCTVADQPTGTRLRFLKRGPCGMISQWHINGLLAISTVSGYSRIGAGCAPSK